MSGLSTVLAATDFSFNAHRAARRAALIAGEHGADLRLLHVVSEPSVVQLRLSLRAATDVERRLMDDARQSLASLAEDTEPLAGSPVMQLAQMGIVMDEILSAADAADLLALGPRGLHPIHDLLLGTLAERLLKKSRRPILVVKSNPEIAYRNVLVPVDFSDHSLAALSFAQTLAPAAAIHVLHAYDCPFEGKLSYAGVSQETIDEYRADTRRQAQAAMDELLARNTATHSRMLPALEHGEAESVIIEKSAEYGVDLIVMGKRGRSFLAEHFLGGVTRLTLARASCDVAVVPELRSGG